VPFRKSPSEYDETFMNAMASAYLERTQWTELRLAALTQLVEPKPGDRILDLGCAAGALTHFFSQSGATVIGVDSEPRAIAKARSLFPDLEFVEADVAKLPFGDESFDKAVAGDLVEHLDDQAFTKMLDEVRRVLAREGALSVYTPNPRHPIERLKARNLILAQNPTHIGLRTAGEVSRLLEANGYTVERMEWTPSFFRGLKHVERALGPRFESWRYRLCIRAEKGTVPGRGLSLALRSSLPPSTWRRSPRCRGSQR
jgi:ubiquinone/menaquinone biosynthesis C-methylase UbiE